MCTAALRPNGTINVNTWILTTRQARGGASSTYNYTNVILSRCVFVHELFRVENIW